MANPSVVQSVISSTNTHSTTQSLTITGVTAFNTIVAFVAFIPTSGSNGITVNQPTDTNGTWPSSATVQNATTNGTAQPTGSSCFVLTNAAAGSHTVSFTFSSSSDCWALIVLVEVANGTIDVTTGSNTSNATATTLTETTAALSNAGDLGLGFVAIQANSGTHTNEGISDPPTNWTSVKAAQNSTTQFPAGECASISPNSISALSATWNWTNGAAATGIIVTFKPSTVPPGAVFVNQGSTFATATATTVAVTYSPVAGNLLVLAVTYDNAVQQSITMSDGGIGNTFNNIGGSQLYDSTNHVGTIMIYAPNCKGGSTTFTATFGATSTFRGIAVIEYSGCVAIPDPGDIVGNPMTEVSAPGTGANGITITSMFPGQSPDLVVLFGYDYTGTSQPNPGNNLTYVQRAAVWSGTANFIDITQNVGFSGVSPKMTAASTDGSAVFAVGGAMFRLQKPIWLHDIYSEQPQVHFIPRRAPTLYSEFTPGNPATILPQQPLPAAAYSMSQDMPPRSVRGPPAIENATIAQNLLEGTLFGRDRVLVPPDYKYRWQTGIAAMPTALRSDTYGLNTTHLVGIQTKPPGYEVQWSNPRGRTFPPQDYYYSGLNSRPLGQDKILYGPSLNLNWDLRNPSPRLPMSELSITGQGQNLNILAFQSTRPPISEANWTVPLAPRRNPQDFIGEIGNPIQRFLTTFAPFITEQFPNPYPRPAPRTDWLLGVPGTLLIPALTQPPFLVEPFPNPLPRRPVPQDWLQNVALPITSFLTTFQPFVVEQFPNPARPRFPPEFIAASMPLEIIGALSVFPPFQNEIFQPNPFPKRQPYDLYSIIQQIQPAARPPPFPILFWDPGLYPVPDQWEDLRRRFRSRLGTEMAHPIPLVATPIPNVVGLQLSQALIVLANAGLTGVPSFVQSNAASPGTVLSQNPIAGSLPISDIVFLTVAAGTTLQQAIYNAVNAGLEPFVVYAASAVVPVDFVIAENPPIGTPVPVNSVVVITASNGPSYLIGSAPVPNVVGLTAFAARNALFAAGLSLGTDIWTSSPIVAGLVLAQSIVAGTLVAFGSVVQLTLSQGPPYPSYAATKTTVQ